MRKLYHYTKLENLISIFSSNSLVDSNSDIIKVSFTEDEVSASKGQVQLVFDYDNLASEYSCEPSTIDSKEWIINKRVDYIVSQLDTIKLVAPLRYQDVLVDSKQTITVFNNIKTWNNCQSEVIYSDASFWISFVNTIKGYTYLLDDNFKEELKSLILRYSNYILLNEDGTLFDIEFLKRIYHI